MFAETILRIEGDDISAVESLHWLDELRNSMEMRKSDEFLSPALSDEKNLLISSEASNLQEISHYCNAFYGTCVDMNNIFNIYTVVPLLQFNYFSFSDKVIAYLDKWLGHVQELKMFNWVTLKRSPQWKDVEAAMKRLSDQNLYDAQANAVALHKQFGYVKNYCTEEKIVEWREKSVSVVARWLEIFNHLIVQSCEYNEIAKMIEYVLSLPATSATVERVFSAMNKSWTQDKTQLNIETLKAILLIKFNMKFTCTDFYKYLKNHPSLLRQISSSDKYHSNTDEQTDDNSLLSV